MRVPVAANWHTCFRSVLVDVRCVQDRMLASAIVRCFDDVVAFSVLPCWLRRLLQTNQVKHIETQLGLGSLC